MTLTGSRLRAVLWGLVGLAALGAASLWFLQQTPPAEAEPYGAGDYRLLTDDGESVDDSVFLGHPSAVFFGFTHCPDVCPTTMGEMALWFDRLGDDAQDLRAFFVTVDPERDTPEVLGAYVGWVSERITGLTGDRAEIDKIIDAWSIYAEKVPLEDGGYTMDHTASVFLLDSQGRFQSTIAYGEGTDTAVAKLRNLLDR